MPGHSRGTRVEPVPDKRGRREFYLTAVGAVVADQASKFVVRALVREGEALAFIPRFLDIAPQYNTGAAFGMLKGAGPLLTLIGLVAIFAVVKLRKQRARSLLLAVSLGLILGGAIGNLIDRLAFGAVFDFLDFHVWPVFNLADVAVTIGGALLLIYWMIASREQR